jgi:hypothetical protein
MKLPAARFLSCLFLLVTIMPGAAAASSKAPKAPAGPLGLSCPDSALVYFIREKNSNRGGVAARIFCDDRLVAVLSNDSYSFVHVAPGTHVLWVRSVMRKEKALYFDFANGQTHYLGFKMDYPLRLMPQTAGLAAIAKSKHYIEFADDDMRLRWGGDETVAKEWGGLKETFEATMAQFEAAAYTPPTNTEGMVKVAMGTRIRAVLRENLSSELNKPGDPVWLSVGDSAEVGGTALIKQGASVRAVVRGVRSTGAFGRGGTIDAAAVSLVTADSTTCPLIGQVVSAGDEVGTVLVGLMTGVVGTLLTRGIADVHPVGELVDVFTRQDIWISPDPPKAAEVPTPPLVDPALRITGPDTVAFNLEQSRIPKSVDLRIEGVGSVTAAELVAVAGVPIPKPLSAQQVSEKPSGFLAVFAGWDICRYLSARKPSETLTIRITKADGSSVFGEVALTVNPNAVR